MTLEELSEWRSGRRSLTVVRQAVCPKIGAVPLWSKGPYLSRHICPPWPLVILNLSSGDLETKEMTTRRIWWFLGSTLPSHSFRVIWDSPSVQATQLGSVNFMCWFSPSPPPCTRTATDPMQLAGYRAQFCFIATCILVKPELNFKNIQDWLRTRK